MTVYVDDMKAPYGRMIMCHMVADSTDELLAMADTIGVARKWLQHPGTIKEHFDIALSKRAIAVQNGAQEITMRQLGMIIADRLEALQQTHGHTPEAEAALDRSYGGPGEDDEAAMNCQQTDDGLCQLAGTEECNECPFSGLL